MASFLYLKKYGNILMKDEKKKLLIVSCDPGGAEILSSWVLVNYQQYKFYFSLAGPAIQIFEEKMKGVFPFGNINSPLENYTIFDIVISSTGWRTCFEILAMKKAKEQGVYIIAYLDHWSDYLGRFKHKNETVLPDQIWVGDEHAKRIAEGCFKALNVEIVYVENEFFKSLRKKNLSLSFSSSNSDTKILYLCEPILDDPRESAHFGLSEYNLLEEFLKSVNRLSFALSITIRLHPLEDGSKYLGVLSKFRRLNIRMTTHSVDLVDDCCHADMVVGIGSMAMMVAHMVGRPIYTLEGVKDSGIYRLPIDFPVFDAEKLL